MTREELSQLQTIATGKPFEVRPRLLKFLETVKVEEKVDGNYTSSQRNSAWLYMTLKVQQLNEAGLEMRKVLKPTYAIPWTKDSFHDHIFIPIQKALYGTDSMKSLKKLQVSKIHEVIERELGEKYGLEYIPFPADSNKALEEMSGEKLGSHTNQRKESYPEYNGAPTI